MQRSCPNSTYILQFPYGAIKGHEFMGTKLKAIIKKKNEMMSAYCFEKVLSDCTAHRQIRSSINVRVSMEVFQIYM